MFVKGHVYQCEGLLVEVPLGLAMVYAVWLLAGHFAISRSAVPRLLAGMGMQQYAEDPPSPFPAAGVLQFPVKVAFFRRAFCNFR